MSDSKEHAKGRGTLGLPIAAAVAGLAWGYLRHRGQRRQLSLALTQAAEWFIAAGGAATLVEVLRGTLDSDDLEELTERVTHATQRITDQLVP